MNAGIAYALGAYLLWGLLPIYLHLLGAIATPEILAHRILWSLVTMLILLVALRRLGWIRLALARPRALGRFALTASLISLNWVLYIWSINSGHTVDASLGYFINPLVNVLIGALLFKERLRLGQKLPLLIFRRLLGIRRHRDIAEFDAVELRQRLTAPVIADD